MIITKRYWLCAARNTPSIDINLPDIAPGTLSGTGVGAIALVAVAVADVALGGGEGE